MLVDGVVYVDKGPHQLRSSGPQLRRIRRLVVPEHPNITPKRPETDCGGENDVVALPSAAAATTISSSSWSLETYAGPDDNIGWPDAALVDSI
ncbi:unnamed protein product [Echinostoma caproni]|uniref:Uncharacterized protein n=1 Tax=Echinostoma caproni TaxID=27848 RepID=A0A183AT66_9TREM|nr:unnamed protein product [Echinostoma caproni]